MNAIFTIGYEGSSVDDFMTELQARGVEILLDVREMPISRKPGFSKRALATAAEEAGLLYRHEKTLGSPKPIRDRLRSDGDLKSFFNDYDDYLATQQTLLVELAQALTGNVALMCYERDPLVCHRRSVARELAKITGNKPVHLGVNSHGQRTNHRKAVHTR